MPTPVDELLAALPDVGLRLNNLFQRDDGAWQANLRDDKDTTEFGLGATPAEALTKALRAAGCAIEEI